MPSGSRIVLRVAAEADIPTPDADQVALFMDSDDGNAPAVKDETGTVSSLVGADGADAPPLTYLDHGNTGSTETITASAADVQRIVLNAATVTITLTGWPASGTPGIIRVWIQQDGTGGRDLVWPGAVVWGDAGEPVWTDMSAGDVLLVDLVTVDGGATVVGIIAGRAGPTGPAGADGADGADGIGSGTVTTVEEVDGSPTDSAVTTIVFPNGTLAIVGHVATYTPAAAAAALLAALAYNTGSDATIATTTNTTITDADSTNLAITFTAPASGKVLVRLSCALESSGGITRWGLRESTTTLKETIVATGAGQTDIRCTATFYLTGLSAGSHTYKWSFRVSSNQTYLIGGPTFGDAVMEVWAAP